MASSKQAKQIQTLKAQLDLAMHRLAGAESLLGACRMFAVGMGLLVVALESGEDTGWAIMDSEAEGDVYLAPDGSLVDLPGEDMDDEQRAAWVKRVCWPSRTEALAAAVAIAKGRQLKAAVPSGPVL